MKNSNKEDWIEDVFNSMQGSDSARPDDTLFARIEERIFNDEARIISFKKLRVVAAAAVALILLNVFAVSQNTQSGISAQENMSEEWSEGQQIFSDFKLYD